MATKEYVTSTGYKLTISPLSPEISRLISKTVDFPKPPFYEIDVLGGEKEKVEHTIDSLRTDEDRDAWAEYLSEHNIARVELLRQKARAVVQKCVQVDFPEDDTWITDQEELGIEVPTDPRARKVHFIKTECIGSETDIFAVVDAAEVLARFDAVEYQDALNLFRDILPRDES